MEKEEMKIWVGRPRDFLPQQVLAMMSGRVWAKLVKGPEDIKLEEQGGYALAGAFVGLDARFALKDGQFVVVAGNAVSDPRRVSTLWQVRSGQVIGIGRKEVESIVSERKTTNDLYRIALYCDAFFRGTLGRQMMIEKQLEERETPKRRIVIIKEGEEG